MYIYTNLTLDVSVRLFHPRSGDSQSQETFLALSTDKETQNYDKECSNHHTSLSTLTPIYIYIYIYICIYVYKISSSIYIHIFIYI